MSGSEQVLRFMGRLGRADADDQVQLAAACTHPLSSTTPGFWLLSIGESSPLNGFRYRDGRTLLRAVATQF